MNEEICMKDIECKRFEEMEYEERFSEYKKILWKALSSISYNIMMNPSVIDTILKDNRFLFLISSPNVEFNISIEVSNKNECKAALQGEKNVES